MAFRCHSAQYFHDRPFGIDHECAAQYAFFTEHFFTPSAISIDHLTVWVTEQREVQRVLSPKFRMARRIVLAYANHMRAECRNVGMRITQAAGFNRAARRVVFWVKIQYQPFTSKIVKETILPSASFRVKFGASYGGCFIPLLYHWK